MATYGVIFTAYQAAEFISPGPDCTLQPWVDLRARSDGPRILIAVVSVPFEGFEHGALDDTHAILRDRLACGAPVTSGMCWNGYSFL